MSGNGGANNGIIIETGVIGGDGKVTSTISPPIAVPAGIEASGNSDNNSVVKGEFSDPNLITLCIPLRYTYLTRPSETTEADYDGRKKIIVYETKSTSLWREADEDDKNKQFVKSMSGTQFIDCLPSLRAAVNQINNEKNSLVTARMGEDRLLENIVTVVLDGPREEVNKQRAKLNRGYFQVERWDIGISKQLVSDSLNEQGDFKSALYLGLEEVAEYCGVSIFVTSFTDKALFSVNSTEENNYLKHQYDRFDGDDYHILIYGDQDAARFANIRMRVILSKLANGSDFIADLVPLELSLQPLVAGPQAVNLHSIQEQASVDIFTMDYLPEVLGSLNPQLFDGEAIVRDVDQLYIVGPSSANVELAKFLIEQVKTRTQMVVKDCVMSHAKLDLLISRYRNKIRDIMNRFATFVQLPYFSSNRSLVRVMGTTASSVEASIQELMRMAADFYEANYWIHGGKSDEEGILVRPNGVLNPKSIEALQKIAASNNCIVTTQNNTAFEIIGYGSDTKRAIAMLKSLSLWDDDISRQNVQISYQLEVSLDLKSFMAGKKYGKMLRIMSNSNVWIKFIPFNEYNFFVVLTADDYSSSDSGIQLLEDEYPSEISFHIPDTYHKEIIGAGGSGIQAIMRKHNVFIKFGNSLELYPNAIAQHKLNNVVIRCPSKNAKSMTLARDELLISVRDRVAEHYNTFVHMPRSHRRIILNENCGIIRQIESKTNSIIQIPDHDNYSDIENDLIEIRGLGTSSEEASQLLRTALPTDYEFRVAHSSKFTSLVNEKQGDFYTKIVVPFRIAFQFEVMVYNQVKSKKGDETAPPYHRIVISHSHEHIMGLDEAIQELTTFLRERELDIIDRSRVKDDPIEYGSAATLGHKRANSALNVNHNRIPQKNLPHSLPTGPAAVSGGHSIPTGPTTPRRLRYESKQLPPGVSYGDAFTSYDDRSGYYDSRSSAMYETGLGVAPVGSYRDHPLSRQLEAETNRQFQSRAYDGVSESAGNFPSGFTDRWQDDEVYEPRRRDRSPPAAPKYNESTIRKRGYGSYY
ncbi:hypothetical protein AWJ20_3994 [Sugiyamaella lignohabitans]|uniref:K Homology domain-containing protein n=1 Tax=Sugiyamaella lignohabitans TaxID=796027 RepID=A0A167C414_9ASCO|nr:uncharacterized protein AWJ20_3994 [Sugiyamaella lignohabitans]ANB11192.1 hypothetical protein AWJ20_3994 [Sugiyamaella lignohabitans]